VWRVSADGFERLEEISRANPTNSDRAFVAMWFDSSRNSIYKDALSPAIEDAGYLPIRIDQVEHVNRIDDEIIAQLRQCRLLVADFTGQRGGVYFEAGFMLGLGRKVYWMCEKSHLNNLHFDTRQFNFIDYENVSEARRRLYNRIMAIDGKGPISRS
jgi:nucleoside 2-deoxyribosyltransferase